MEEQSGTVVSVCIPSFNRAELISETLDSICAQTYPHWEALVVDDGSTDDSVELVRSYCARDSRIRLLIRDREPKGACTCRNIAVESARGTYVIFLDTDDVIAPFCLAQRIGVMQADPALDFAIFSMLLFSGKAADADRLWNVETGVDDLVRVLRLDPVCQGTGTLWRRDSFIRAGMWDERLTMWQDIELHVRAFARDFMYIKRLDLPPDVYLRETETSLSRGSYQSRAKLEGRERVARKAVEELRRAGRTELIPEVRHLCSSVVLGAASSGNLDIARRSREWGAAEGVLTNAEAMRLRVIEFFRRTRVDRLRPVRNFRDSLASAFRVESTLGSVRVERSHA